MKFGEMPFRANVSLEIYGTTANALFVIFFKKVWKILKRIVEASNEYWYARSKQKA